MAESAFFTDADFAMAKREIDAGCIRLVVHLRTGGTVVMPADGIGTGRAELAVRAPRIADYLQRALKRLKEIADEPAIQDGNVGPGLAC